MTTQFSTQAVVVLSALPRPTGYDVLKVTSSPWLAPAAFVAVILK
jgi:hypothetical protein